MSETLLAKLIEFLLYAHLLALVPMFAYGLLVGAGRIERGSE